MEGWMNSNGSHLLSDEQTANGEVAYDARLGANAKIFAHQDVAALKRARDESNVRYLVVVKDYGAKLDLTSIARRVFSNGSIDVYVVD
jgi:hypothetical protein